jgi:hypothetical protein
MLNSTVQAATPRRTILMAGATAALAVAAMGFAGGAQARSDVQFSVGVVLPGAQIGVTNAYPVYSQPVYHQPRPVYVQPQPVYYPPPPVYYQPRPVYHVRPPVYVVPAPVYYRGGYRHPGYGHGHYRGHGGHRGHDGHRGHGGYR